MRHLSFLMICATFLSGCHNAPTPPVVPDLTIIAVEGLDPYLFGQQSDGSGEIQRIPILSANKYKCTTPEGFVAGKVYGKELEKWINQNCNCK